MADTATLTPPAQTWRPSEPARPSAHSVVNVGELERWASLVGGGALALAGGSLVYRGATGHCEMYHLLGVNTAEGRGPATSVRARHGVKVVRSATIDRPQQELFQFWRNLENLPRFMRHLQSVQNVGHKRSHWVAKGPLGTPVEWDAEIITERQNELIGWRSLPGSVVDNAGSVHFRPAPGGRGTEVQVELKYDPPAGKVGATIAWLFGRAPEQEIQEDLRHFKELLEAGEIPTTQGQPQGRC